MTEQNESHIICQGSRICSEQRLHVGVVDQDLK